MKLFNSHKIYISIFFTVSFLFCLFVSQEVIEAKETKKTSAKLDAIIKVESGDPKEGRKIFLHYCAVCHGEKGKGDGVNSENITPSPTDFTDKEYMDSRTDEKIYKVIKEGGRGAAKSKYMPPWGKTFSDKQIFDLISFVRSFSSVSSLSDSKPVNGKMPEYDCQICHVKEKNKKIIAPDLGYEKVKFNRNWLFSFLKNPYKIRPVGFMPLTKSRMPNFQFTDEEAEALVEYLTTRDESITEDMILKEVGGVIEIKEGEVEAGAKLFKDLGCGGCHKVGPKGGAVGPDLSKSAHRLKPVWLFKWLKNPQSIRPDAPMPNFGLEDKDIGALISYIMNLREETPFPGTTTGQRKIEMDKVALKKRGERLVREKNCLGCHTMHTINNKEGGSGI